MQRITWGLIESEAVPFSMSSVKDVFERCMKDWSDVCGIQISYTTNHRTANIVNRFGRIDGSGQVLARMQLPCGNIPQVTGTYDVNENFVISRNPARHQIGLEHVIKHEIGHAIGIDHLSTGNLLAPYYDPSVIELQEGDKAAARELYGANQDTEPTDDLADRIRYTLQGLQSVLTELAER